jgi:hypothetical protein
LSEADVDDLREATNTDVDKIESGCCADSYNPEDKENTALCFPGVIQLYESEEAAKGALHAPLNVNKKIVYDQYSFKVKNANYY